MSSNILLKSDRAIIESFEGETERLSLSVEGFQGLYMIDRPRNGFAFLNATYFIFSSIRITIYLVGYL